MKVRRWKKVFHANENDNKVGGATHTKKTDFQTKAIKRPKTLYNDKRINIRREYYTQ